MVRFGNVLGSSCPVVPLFRKQNAAGGPITLIHPEIIRFFFTIQEAAQLVLKAAVLAEGGDVFLLDMGDPVLIKDMAEQMVASAACRCGMCIFPIATLKLCAPAFARAKSSTKNS
jgi:FlaA1/EpsC-like NDP-sugar epimerase